MPMIHSSWRQLFSPSAPLNLLPASHGIHFKHKTQFSTILLNDPLNLQPCLSSSGSHTTLNKYDTTIISSCGWHHRRTLHLLQLLWSLVPKFSFEVMSTSDNNKMSKVQTSITFYDILQPPKTRTTKQHLRNFIEDTRTPLSKSWNESIDHNRPLLELNNTY